MRRGIGPELREQMLTIARTYIVVLVAMTALDPARVAAGQLDDAWAAFRKRDCVSALNIWRPLAEQGDAAAQTGLGILYDNGCAVPKDEAQAFVWYSKAADQGNAEAEYRLGQAYVQGARNLPRDRSQGLALMIRAGEHGHATSLCSIGDFYRNGLFGFPKDDAEAIAWYRKAADLGSDTAEGHLAVAYELGRGVPKDLVQATSWYRRSEAHTRKQAEDGDVAAQLALGLMYEWGLGVMSGLGTIPMDKSAALFWYRKAAEQDGPLKREAEIDLARLEAGIKAGSSKDPR
jgi:TPR repeat protein